MDTDVHDLGEQDDPPPVHVPGGGKEQVVEAVDQLGN